MRQKGRRTYTSAIRSGKKNPDKLTRLVGAPSTRNGYWALVKAEALQIPDSSIHFAPHCSISEGLTTWPDFKISYLVSYREKKTPTSYILLGDGRSNKSSAVGDMAGFPNPAM
jgi:hypothetical protein